MGAGSVSARGVVLLGLLVCGIALDEVSASRGQGKKGGKGKSGKASSGGKGKGSTGGKSGGGGGGGTPDSDPFGDLVTPDAVACEACQSRSGTGGTLQLTSAPKMIRFKIKGYDSSGFASGADHPATNSRGIVACTGAAGDPSVAGNDNSCSMRPVVGDSGDSTAGCPKFFTYEDTEFLGYDADAADGVGVFVPNFQPSDITLFPGILGGAPTTCAQLAAELSDCDTTSDPSLNASNCQLCADIGAAGVAGAVDMVWERDCPQFCGITTAYDLRPDVPLEGTIQTTNVTAGADNLASFFRPTGAADSIGTDCEPFAVKFACFDGARKLTSVYTDYIGFSGARMNPASGGESLAHILHDTLVVVHDHGSPLPASLRCEIEGPRELCFGPPSTTKGATDTNRANQDSVLCPARAGDPCFGLIEAACSATPTADLCQFDTNLGTCARSFPCSGREVTLGAPGVRSCGIPGLHDLGFETSSGTSVHTARPYRASQAMYAECRGTQDPFYVDQVCSGLGMPFASCNVENKAATSLYPDGVRFPAYWDYTQQGAFHTADGTLGAKASLATSLYADKSIQQDTGVNGTANSFLEYITALNVAGIRPGPATLAGLLDVPVGQATLRNGCGFNSTAPCSAVTHYPSPTFESVLSTGRTPALLRTHHGGQGSGICYPVQGSTGVPFGTNGVDEFNTRATKSLPGTYNPYFKQEVTLDLSCGAAGATLTKGNQYGMLEVDGFVRSDNTDDTACGTCAGADASLNAVCVGDVAESSDNFALNPTRNVCHKEADNLVVQQACTGPNTSCPICGDHDTSGRSKTKLTQLTFRWVPAGSLDSSAISAGSIAVQGATVALGFDGGFQTAVVTANGNNFGANTDFTVGGTTATLHTSCSRPVFVGLGIQFTGSMEGALIVTGFATLDGRTDSDCIDVPPPAPRCDLCTCPPHRARRGMGMRGMGMSPMGKSSSSSGSSMGKSSSSGSSMGMSPPTNAHPRTYAPVRAHSRTPITCAPIRAPTRAPARAPVTNRPTKAPTRPRTRAPTRARPCTKPSLETLTFLWSPADGTTALSNANFGAEDSTTAFGVLIAGSGQTILVTPTRSDFGANTDLTVLRDRQTLHTSCSRPIYMGFVVQFATGTLTISGFQSDAPRSDADCPSAVPTPAPTAPAPTPTTTSEDFTTCSCFTLIRVTEDPLLWETPALAAAAPKFIRPQCFMAGREGYAVNSGLVASGSHDVFSVTQARFSVPCCPHVWVTCAASFWAVANSKEDEMDYLGSGPGDPTQSQAIALTNAGVQVAAPNCATDATSTCCTGPTCCGVDALTEFTIHIQANIPGYCYTLASLFKNAPSTRDLVTSEAQTCADFTALTRLQPPTCTAVPTAMLGAPAAGGGMAATTSSVVVAVALVTIVFVGAVRLLTRRPIRAPSTVDSTAFDAF